MVVSKGVISLGSYLSSVVAGMIQVALRVSKEVRREVSGPGLSPFGNLAMMKHVSWICSV